MINRWLLPGLCLVSLGAAPVLAQQPAAHPAAGLSNPGAPAAPANTANPTLLPGDSPAAAEASRGQASGVPGGFKSNSESSAVGDDAAPPNPAVARLAAIGTPVKDSEGIIVGKVSEVVKDKQGRALGLVIHIGRRNVTLSIADLSADGRYLVGRQSRRAWLAG